MWAFDVDGCLVDALTGTSLRPGARALLAHLHDAGATVLWWSAGGDDYARRRAVALGVSHLVAGFHGKNQRDEHGRYLTDHFLSPHHRATFVDDRPEDLPLGAPFLAVSPYLGPNPHDRGLREVGQAAGLPEDGLFG
ncbi:MAG: hypothetical protein JWL70_2051 [Acidimicrobiia bacterium]|nr:hypothetical protein [Acidimicrobiia bacterium]